MADGFRADLSALKQASQQLTGSAQAADSIDVDAPLQAVAKALQGSSSEKAATQSAEKLKIAVDVWRTQVAKTSEGVRSSAKSYQRQDLHARALLTRALTDPTSPHLPAVSPTPPSPTPPQQTGSVWGKQTGSLWERQQTDSDPSRPILGPFPQTQSTRPASSSSETQKPVLMLNMDEFLGRGGR